MTHIDAAVLEALVAAGDAVAHAARNRLCSCSFNVPYDSGQVERVLVDKCFRCRTLEQWAKVREKVGQVVQLPPVQRDGLAITLASLLDEATTELFEVTRDPGRPLADTEKVRTSIRQRANNALAGHA